MQWLISKYYRLKYGKSYGEIRLPEIRIRTNGMRVFDVQCNGQPIKVLDFTITNKVGLGTEYEIRWRQ